MCDVCQNLKDKAVLEKDLYYKLLDEILLTKASTNDPNFKIDTEMGEGKATKDEKQYRQDLQDLIKQVWDKKDKLNDSKVKELIDNLFINEDSEGKQLVTEFITDIYTTNAESMVDKLRELGIKKKVPKNSEVLDALLAWQQFAVEKVGMELYYGIMNQRLGKTYFQVAYGSKEET